MADLSAFNFWVDNPDFRLFKDEVPEGTPWCASSQPLVEWGDRLLERLTHDPHPGKVGFAKWKLLDRYCRLYLRSPFGHRPETNGDSHPCSHQALLEIWQRLEDLEMAAAIPELEPPQVMALPAATVPAGLAPEPAEEEITGTVLGEEDLEP
jgi:hypothetical protein